jgi:hypothetical protein
MTEGIERARRRSWGRIAVAIAIVVLPLAYFYPALTGEVALVQGDGWTQNLGVRVLTGRLIAAREWPLWNPYIFAGTPLLASIYPGALYPPNWLFALFSPGVAMNAVVITTYHLALWGTYLYARRIGATRLGSLLAGIAFTFGGYLLAHMGHTSRIAAAAWLPWILLALEMIARRGAFTWAALGAVFVALQQYAGEPQMTFYTVLVAGAGWIFHLVKGERAITRRRFIWLTLIMACGGALLAMPQLLPQRELLAQGERARITYEYFSGFSLPPRQIFNLIFPYFFGGAAMDPYKVSYWGEWSVGETCGYVGLLTVMLSLLAVYAGRKNRMVWFWAGVLLISYLLALGGYWPRLNQLLYGLPVYNLFRAPSRHLFEFTFAAAVLSGLGVSALARAPWNERLRAWAFGAGGLTLLFAATTIAYRFYGESLVTQIPRPPHSGSLAIPDFLFPLAAFISSVIALAWYARARSALAGVLLAAVLLADLAAFGQFFYWRVIRMSVNERLQDPPSVKFIKEREGDPNAFRIVSHSLLPFAYNYELLNYPNVSIARGLPSVNGYDALRLLRTSTLAGEMTLDGYVTDPSVFGNLHQGFNLLNVKYLLHERPVPIDASRGLNYDGVWFEPEPLNWELKPGRHEELGPGGVTATALALVTTMANSGHLADGTPVARIRLHAKGGSVIEHEVQAGRDTAEWAWDRKDVRASIRHARARVVESWPAGDFEAHRYLARFEFPRAEIERIELDYLLEEASLIIMRASLIDAQTGLSVPLEIFNPPRERWRMLARFGQIDIYENLAPLPRVWFVREIKVAPRAAVLSAVRSGRMANGEAFKPLETALIEAEDQGRRPLPVIGEAPGARAQVTSYRANRIEIATENPHPGFLVASEIYYRGWEALIDGRRVPVERVDHALRGVAVPAGAHRVEFVFLAHSFRRGALYAALGIGLLAAGLWIDRSRHKSGDRFWRRPRRARDLEE